MVGLINIEELRLKNTGNSGGFGGNSTENDEESDENSKGSNKAETGRKKGGYRAASTTGG
jgi:hypothetical protein